MAKGNLARICWGWLLNLTWLNLNQPKTKILNRLARVWDRVFELEILKQGGKQKTNFCFEHFSGMKKNELLMWAKFQNELFWGTRKKWTFRMKKMKKQKTKKFIFSFFRFFSFLFHSANLVWHESSFQKLAQHESSFFPVLKFWSAGRFTLFDSLLFDFFCNFEKSEIVFYYYSFCF